MGLRSLALICSLLMVPAAFAQDDSTAGVGDADYSNSEYLHQAPGGAFELTPGIDLISRRLEYKTTTAKTNKVDVPLTVKAEYGFSDLFSLSAQLGYSVGATSVDNCPTGNTCNSTTATGLMDPVVSANFRIPLPAGVIRAGAEAHLAIEDSETESDGDTNVASGGMGVAPFMAYELGFGRNILGAKISYDLYKGERTYKDKQGTPSTEKIKDGQDLSLAVFYEFNFPRVVSLGAAVEHISTSATKTETNGVTTADKNPHNFTSVRFYVPLRFNPRVTLVPSLSVGAHNRRYTSTVDSDVVTSLGCFARFTF